MNITNKNTGTSAQLELKRFEMLEHLVRRTLDEAALRGDLSTVRSIMGLAQTFCLKTEKEPKIFLLHRLRDHPIWQYSAFWISAIFEAVSYERVKFNSSTVSPRSSDRNKTGKVRNFLTRRNRRKSDPSQVRDPVETEMMTFAVCIRARSARISLNLLSIRSLNSLVSTNRYDAAKYRSECNSCGFHR